MTGLLMLYFIFGSRTLKKKFIRRLEFLRGQDYPSKDVELLAQMPPMAASQASMLTKIADTHVFTNTTQTYFSLGEDMHRQLLADLQTAKKFIFVEYFIIEEGIFWNSILDILKEKAAKGVEVRVVYDDIGCMMALPGMPDKWLVKELTRSHYQRLLKAGVEIYEYEPGFVHAKCYLADDEYAMVGTINMDHRSLVNNFENGVWMHRCECLDAIKADFADTLAKSIRIEKAEWTLPQRFIRSVVKVFAPLM